MSSATLTCYTSSILYSSSPAPPVITAAYLTHNSFTPSSLHHSISKYAPPSFSLSESWDVFGIFSFVMISLKRLSPNYTERQILSLSFTDL